MHLSHAPTIARSSDAILTGVFDRDAGARRGACAKSIGARSYDRIEALVEASDVDAVIVATPNRYHSEGVLAAAAARKHVLCEKPLALDIASAGAMIRPAPPPVWFSGWLQPAFLGSGADREGASHVWLHWRGSRLPLDLFRKIDRLSRDDPLPLRPLAIGRRHDHRPHHPSDRPRPPPRRRFLGVFAELVHSALPDKVDDNVWLLARFANGARGSLTSDRYSPAIGDGTDIFGTEGSIHIATETLNPFHAAPLAVYTERHAKDLPDILREAHYPDAWWKGFEGGWLTIKPPRRNPYDAQLAEFCAAIREGRAPAITGEDGLKAQEVVQGAYISMREGRWVDLPLPADAPFIVPDYN